MADNEHIAQDEIAQLPPLVKYMFICGIIAIIVCLYNVFSSKGVSYGFWEWVAIVIFYTIVPGICVTIANFLRMLAKPDFVMTNEGMTGLLKVKIFWAVGPQCIGWFIGLVASNGMLESLFGIKMS